MTDRRALTAALLAATGLVTTSLLAQSETDWPQWGRDASRNMTAIGAVDLPEEFDAGRFSGTSEEIDMATTENVRWVAKLGSQSYGNPTVARGRVLVGTNNDSPRDPRFEGDRSCLYCLDEKTGELVWQLNVPKLGTGQVSDWESIGICSSPSIEGDRVYLVTNRCEIMCLDLDGMADGNDGVVDEGAYMAREGQQPLDGVTPMEVTKTDADILWRFDMMAELGVRPHNITSSSVMVVGDRLWASTSNGVDHVTGEISAPNAPSLVVVDKNTGALLGVEASGLSSRMFHANWTSPALLEKGGRKLVVFGGPDGVLYAFETEPVKGEDGSRVLQLAWQHDCNPREYRVDADGEKRLYPSPKGPSELLSTPVVADGLVYAAIGQDPEHGEGRGNLSCVDIDGNLVWEYRGLHRTIATLSVSGGMVFAADFSGFLNCLDAKTGELLWVYDTAAHIWGSTLVAGGRVFVGTEDGFLVVAPATRELDESAVQEIDFAQPIYSSPIVANDTLYVATHTHLFAIGK